MIEFFALWVLSGASTYIFLLLLSYKLHDEAPTIIEFCQWFFMFSAAGFLATILTFGFYFNEKNWLDWAKVLPNHIYKILQTKLW